MTAVLVAGFGAGCGVVLLVALLRRNDRGALVLPVPVPGSGTVLGVSVAAVRGRGSGAAPDSSAGEDARVDTWYERFERLHAVREVSSRLGRVLVALPGIGRVIVPALVVVEESMQGLCTRSLAGALAGMLAVPVLAALAGAAGVPIPVAIPVWTTLLGMFAGGSIPILDLFARTRARRDLAGRALSSYIDLVVLCLAGGMGIEGALHAAAQVGDNWLQRRLRFALGTARGAGAQPWHHIRLLGEEIGVPALVELSVIIGLSGSEGARIRATLSAKAAAMRKRELAEAEMRANRATERLFLPSMLLLMGFLIFLGYPATTRILGGF